MADVGIELNEALRRERKVAIFAAHDIGTRKVLLRYIAKVDILIAGGKVRSPIDRSPLCNGPISAEAMMTDRYVYSINRSDGQSVSSEGWRFSQNAIAFPFSDVRAPLA